MPIRSIKMFSSAPLFFMGIAFAVSAGFGQSQNQCAEMAKFKSPGVQLEITKAAWVPAGPAPAMGPGGNIESAARSSGGNVDKINRLIRLAGLRPGEIPEVEADLQFNSRLKHELTAGIPPFPVIPEVTE